MLGNSTKIISRGLLKEIIIKSIVYLHNGQVDKLTLGKNGRQVDAINNIIILNII